MIDTLRSTDRHPVLGASLTDLDMAVVHRHITTAIERGRYDGSSDPQAYLQQFTGVTMQDTTIIPTLAGMLMFAAEPDRWMSACGVDIAQFNTPHPHPTSLVFSTQVRGTITEVIERTLDLIWARSEHRYRIEGSERIEEHAYSQNVLRELTVNALCHRDWEMTGSFVRIQLFPGFIEWISPGGLPSGVTPENLRDAQISRNPALAQFLYHSGRIEKFGMGIDMVLDTLSTWGCDPPEFRNDPHFFSFRVWGKKLRSAPTRVLPQLSDRQLRMLGEIERRKSCTAADLATTLNQHARTIQREIKVLLEHGLIQDNGSKTHGRTYAPTMSPDDL